MKRRKFIKATLLTAPAVATTAVAGTRLFGTPGSIEPTANAFSSVSERFTLPIARSGLPPKFWGKVQSVSSIISNVLRSPDEGKAFSAAPAAYLAKHGLDHSDAILQEESVKLIAVVSSPGFKEAVAARDYSAVMSYMRTAGSFANFDATNLQKELESALKKNAGEVRQLLLKSTKGLPESEREAFLSILGSAGTGASEDDLALAYDLLTTGVEDSTAAAIVAATIAVVLVTVAALVVLWVGVGGWVVVSGPEDTQQISSTSYGKLAEVDPNLLKDYERITRVAAITGDKQLIEQGTREMILAESSAIVNAMRGAGILNISAEGGERLIEAMTMYAHKVIGV